VTPSLLKNVAINHSTGKIRCWPVSIKDALGFRNLAAFTIHSPSGPLPQYEVPARNGRIAIVREDG